MGKKYKQAVYTRRTEKDPSSSEEMLKLSLNRERLAWWMAEAHGLDTCHLRQGYGE